MVLQENNKLLSIIIPAYNEQDNIHRTFNTIRQILNCQDRKGICYGMA